MSMVLRCAFGTALVALGVQGASAQPVTSCPAGYAMLSSDPSGKNITCVALPDTGLLLNMLGTEKSERQAADDAINARIDGLGGGEASIVGKWAMTGTTSCLQSTGGFNALNSPQAPTAVSQLTGTTRAVRTFNADGTGHSVGITQSLSTPQLVYNPGQPPFVGPGVGGASIADLNSSFTWSIQPDGTLLIDDDNVIPQNFLSPPARVGWTVSIANVPSFVGHISKDKKTIVMMHATMAIEVSTVRDQDGAIPFPPTQRYCTRERVLTRLPD